MSLRDPPIGTKLMWLPEDGSRARFYILTKKLSKDAWLVTRYDFKYVGSSSVDADWGKEIGTAVMNPDINPFHPYEGSCHYDLDCDCDVDYDAYVDSD